MTITVTIDEESPKRFVHFSYKPIEDSIAISGDPTMGELERVTDFFLQVYHHFEEEKEDANVRPRDPQEVEAADGPMRPS